MSGASVYDRVALWLRERPGQCFCKICIVQKVGLPGTTSLSSITSRIGTSAGSKYTGKCSGCERVTTVVTANGGW